MALHESDISWQLLRRIVKEWAGDSAELTDVKPLHGGCISDTLALHTKDGARAVLKISTHRVDRSYQDEAEQLKLLGSIGLPVPEVYVCKLGSLEDPNSYILMEFVDGVDLHEARRQCSPDEFDQIQTHLAELVTQIHEQKGEMYRRVRAVNGAPAEAGHSNWTSFYREVYDPIWHEAEKDHSLPIKTRKLIGKVHERLERFLRNDDGPRLVHWDLWATNLLAAKNDDGKWKIKAVLDPACKFAHTEAEIAYLELFHTVTPAFMKAYQANHRLSPDYQKFRKPIYQLYPLINHLRLFGHEYLKPLMGAVERVGTLV